MSDCPQKRNRQSANRKRSSSRNESRPTTPKKSRRSPGDINRLKREIYRLCQLHQPLTVRNLFYRMVAQALIDKTQSEYKNVVVRLAGLMREAGELPWDWIVDETRWRRLQACHASLEDALEEMQQYYRRDIWIDQECNVEVWCESDSIAGMIYRETNRWNVPLMAARGFSSKSFVWETAKVIERSGKPCQILYVGDYDPSGVFIDRDIISKLRRYAPNADITFDRIAVTQEQIEEWNLPSRPPKKGDSRAKDFEGECVETEAIEPAMLKQLVRSEIEWRIDDETLRATRQVEAMERQTLETFINGFHRES